MYSNIFLQSNKSHDTINLKSKQKVNVYLVANEEKDMQKTIDINVINNNIVNVYCLILSSGKHKKVDININHHGDASISNIYVKTLVNNAAIVKVNCISNCATKTHKNQINQTIDGLMFDDKSLIQALPCLDINIDDIMAKHTVNIGQVDPEIIFYLNSKGLSTLEAYQFLINSFIKDLKPYLDQYHVNINRDIRLLVGGNYE